MTHSIAPSRLSRRSRHLTALALFVVVSGGLIAFLSSQKSNAAVATIPGVVQMMDGDHQYSYHLVTGTEGLFDLKADPRSLINLAETNPELVLKLRMRLLKDLRVGTLEELRSGEQDTINRLKTLGYL